MKCCGCDNEARYIDELGAAWCGLCDAVTDAISIRPEDIPELLGHLRSIIERRRSNEVPTEIATLERADVDAMLQLISKRGVTF